MKQWVDTSFSQINEKFDKNMQIARFQYPRRTSIPSTDSRINAVAKKIVDMQNPQGDEDDVEYCKFPAKRRKRHICFVYDSDFPVAGSQVTALTTSTQTDSTDDDNSNKKRGRDSDVTYAKKAKGRSKNCRASQKHSALEKRLAELEETAEAAKKSADES